MFLLATALAIVITWPVASHFGQEIYGTPGDASGAVTQYWWWGYAITHGKPILDLNLEGVPVGSEWSEIPFVVLPLIVVPPLSVAIGPIATYNLLIISSFPLTAWAVFLLARRLGLSALAATFSGLAFAFAPYHTEKAQGHGNETHMEFIALTFYFLVRWRGSRRLVHAALAGVMVGLQLWMDYSLTLILAFGVAAYFVGNLAFRDRTQVWPRWIIANLKGGSVLVGITALFGPLMLLAAHRPGQESYSASFSGTLKAVNRSYDELVVYSARLHEYVQPWHANPLLPGSVRTWEQLRLHGSNWTESSLTIGFTVMLLSLIGLLNWRHAFTKLFGLVLMAVGLAMSEPPIVHLAGHQAHAPSYYLFHLITFFRVYARFAILVLLGTALLAGLGLEVLEGHAGYGRRRLLMLVPFLLIAVEFNNLPPTHVSRILPAPAEYTWLRDHPSGILMEYPAQSGPAPVLEVQVRQYELYQMVHLHPTFLNEVTQSGKVATAAATLEPYYKPGVAELLKSYGIRYVFVHRQEYSEAGWNLPTSVEGLSYTTTINGVDIYVTK